MICDRASLSFRKTLIVSLLPFLALGVCRGEAQRIEGQPAEIPMRDGIVLRADLLLKGPD